MCELGSGPKEYLGMFEVDRKLLNVNFEGYKLAEDIEVELTATPLPSPLDIHEPSSDVSQFERLADELFQNYFHEGNTLILEDGYVCEIDGADLCLKRMMEVSSGPCGAAGPYICSGACLYKNFDPVQLNLRFAEIPIRLSHYASGHLLLYQVVPAGRCSDLLSIPDAKKASSLFFITLFKEGDDNSLHLLSEYTSWSRPLFARIFDDAAILGSPTGFSPLSANIEQATILLEDVLLEGDEEEEEDVDEIRVHNAIIRSFSLNGIFLASSPLVTFLGFREDSLGNPLIAIQSGVDMPVFRLLDSNLRTQHIYTLHAFAFIQSGKTKKKFIAFSEGLGVLAETEESIYIYLMSGIEECRAKQILVTLPEKESIYGLRIDDNHIQVLCQENLYSIALKFINF